MKKKYFVYTLVILTVVNLSALGTLVYHRFKMSASHYPHEKPGRGLDQLKRDLSLSSEQVARFQEYRQAFHAELDSLSAQQNTLRQQLIQELIAASPDPTRLSEIVESINRLQLEAQKRVVKHLLDIKGILSLEQQEKFFTVVLERFISAGGPGKYSRGD